MEALPWVLEDPSFLASMKLDPVASTESARKIRGTIGVTGWS